MTIRVQWVVLGTAVLLIGAAAAGRLARAPGAAPPRATVVLDDSLTALDRAILTRAEFKERLAEAVIAGRLSLLEAASAFREIDAEGRPHLFHVRDAYPEASSEEEAYCRSVIAHVRAAAPSNRADDLGRRLQDELDARLHDGSLILPPPSGGTGGESPVSQ